MKRNINLNSSELDNGIKINAIKSVSKIHLGVDTEDDLKKANEIAKDDSYK